MSLLLQDPRRCDYANGMMDFEEEGKRKGVVACFEEGMGEAILGSWRLFRWRLVVCLNVMTNYEEGEVVMAIFHVEATVFGLLQFLYRRLLLGSLDVCPRGGVDV